MPAPDPRDHDTAPAPVDLARSDTVLARTLASQRPPATAPTAAGQSDDRTIGAGRSSDGEAWPATIGRYHVLERLGAGGMGVVLAAYDPDLDRKVAVKLLRAERSHESQLRLLREAQALARLSHPNVVQIHDAGVLGEQIFIAMEFVRGEDLRSWLAARPRSPTEILRLFVDAGRGLAAAHAAGLVHRDFKPENVLVGADGRARVADFGLARADDEPRAPADIPTAPDHPLGLSLTATGAVLGTPAYMSPEQYMGLPAGPASDQFSFCVALWEALHGQRPFAGDDFASTSLAVLSGHLREPPPTPRVPRKVSAALRRGLARQPEDRHPNLTALLAALHPDEARTRWLGAAVLSVMAVGTAFAVGEWRARAASACSGGAAELAEVWDDERRAAVAASLPDPDLAARVLAGLDRYADAWTVAHRNACQDRRRGELDDERFADRGRCLERRRRALASAVDVLAAPGTAPDAPQLVARLPAIAACDDPETARAEAYVPSDPTLAAAVRDLDERLLAAQARDHAGDVAGAHAAIEAVITAARDLEVRPLLAEALLVRGRLDGVRGAPAPARASFEEAAIHALASGRDALAAEAFARRIFADAHLGAVDDALAVAPIARALAERLPAPAVALARLDHNLGSVQFIGQRDRDGAHARFQRAAADLERAADADPLERAAFHFDVATTADDPDDRRAAFDRAEALLTEHLGPDHLRTLQLRWQRGLTDPDPRASEATLAAVCPQFPARHPALREHCATCFYNLGLLHAERGAPDLALADLRAQDACDGPASDPDAAAAVTLRHGSAAAFQALADGRPADALAAADAALEQAGDAPRPWWIAVHISEVTLARGRALAALARPAEARAALTEAIAGLEATRALDPLSVYGLWLPAARALLQQQPPDPAP